MNHTGQENIVSKYKKKKILNFSSTIVWIRLSQRIRNILIHIYIYIYILSRSKEETSGGRSTFAVDKTR